LVKPPILAASAIALPALAGCTRPLSPSPAPATIDVLTYLLGDAALWPRVGNHGQNQIMDLARREVCWVKYANPRRFECWRWDDQFVYHEVDHALDGDSNDFGLGAGWYEWERSGVPDLFNRLGGPATLMARSVWCDAP
jgi:hypothetical protein